MPRQASFRLTLAVAVIAMASLTACGDAGEAGPLAELARVHDTRSIGPRVSIERHHRPCNRVSRGEAAGISEDGQRSIIAPAAGLAPSICTGDPPPTTDRLLALASRVSAEVTRSADPEALHAAGLIDLLWGDATENSIGRAISYLSAAARLAEEPAPALADLAAAHLVRAELVDSPRDVLEALEAADQAAALDPSSSVALHNLAYAMDRLTLDQQASDAWISYAATERRAGWAAEAALRSAQVSAGERIPTPPAPAADSDEVRAFAREFPREARLLGWDEVLGRWGEALMDGDEAAAAGNLRLARRLGEELERSGGDASLADAVRAIDEATSTRADLRTLARAHADYAAGRRELAGTMIRPARAMFERVVAARPPSEALHAWAETYRSITTIFDGRLTEGWLELRAVADAADESRHPALTGQALAGMTTARMRDGRYEEALQTARLATRHYERAREPEAVGSQIYLQADTELTAGTVEAGYENMYRALEVLRSYRRSVWRYNSLIVLGEAAADEQLERASIRLLSEAIAAADLAESLPHQVESRAARARVFWEMEDTASARVDLAHAARYLDAMESPVSRAWLRIDLHLASAAVAARLEPRRAIAALDSILADPGSTGTEMRLMEAYVRRAEARLTVGDRAGAAADLHKAANVVSEASTSTTSSTMRMALLDKARTVFDRLALVEASEGDPGQALTHLERGRVSFAGGPVRSSASDAERLVWPVEQTSLSYMLVGDTLLVWAARGEALEMARTVVPREELTRAVDRVRTSLELGAGEETLRRDLERLHEWLLGPVRDRLGPAGGEIVVVADGEIAAVPFPALLDGASGRYLVEDHALRFAPSLRDAAGRGESEPGREAAAVFVGDPGGVAGSAGFAPLPASAAEVTTLASYYPEAELITGDTIGRRAVTSALRRSEIFHFAGHAVFDESRPELSFLVLAPGPDGEPARLTAAALEGLDLTGVRLVVLSACETLRSGSGRSGGFAGFAGILLQAGVDGMVGSLWRVDDASTARLMIEFHRTFASSGDVPSALRAAQLQMLRSTDPKDRSPAAWAGFRYAGN